MGEKQLKNIYTSQRNFKKIYRKLGLFLKKLHSFSGKGFGHISNK